MRNFLLLLSLTVCSIGFAQCPAAPLTLSSQAEVDAFPTNFPGCSNLQQDITISGADITDLSGLSQITGTNRRLIIKDNPILENLNGLGAINFSGQSSGLEIENNPLLTSLTGLSNITNTGDIILTIKDNPALSSLDGLLGVLRIDSLEINNNDLLTNLNGLDFATRVSGLVILNNDQLTSLLALSQAGNGGLAYPMEIGNNPQLLNLDGLEGYTDFVVSISIYNNQSLLDLDGLNGFTNLFIAASTVWYSIDNNPVLSDISGLANIAAPTLTQIQITNNLELSVCSVESVCDHLNAAGMATINNNASGCNSEAEILANCSNCPTQAVILSSQSEVDNFAGLYPGCNILTVDLTIGGPDITDLSGLQDITEILGILTIENNPLLVTMNGLSEITFSGLNGGIAIKNNPLLTSISQFNGEVNWLGINIRDNPSLNSLVGFGGITHALELVILNCDSLQDLSGLENIDIVDNYLTISGNDALTSLSALSNLSTGVVFVGLFVTDNPLLENLVGLEGATELHFLVIANNNNLQNFSGLDNVVGVSGASIEIAFNSVLTDISALNNLMVQSAWLIRENTSLSMCSISSICYLIENNMINLDPIDNNAPGCNSVQEIIEYCDVVFIPDTNFLNALLNHNPIIDTDADDKIQYSEAEAFTGTIQVTNKSITSFTGIEAFFNITGFEGGNNQITSLRLLENSSLTSVVFENNPLLEGVNLKNGNNTEINNFQGLNCPNLQYVCVDNVAYAQANFTNIDPQVIFTENCLLSVSEFDLNQDIVLYPNPVSSMLQIDTSPGIVLQKATVYSVLGEELFFTLEETVDFSNLSAGIYFIKMTTDHGSVTKKIVKE